MRATYCLRLRCFGLLSAVLVFASGCATLRPPVPPGTVPKPRPPTVTEEQYGHTVLEQLTERWDIDYNDPRLDRVTAIVERLTGAAGAGKDPWHVFLLRAPDVKNAAATRGNHVFVWSGLLDFTQTDEETATFISHEIAHVLAGHTDPDPNEEVRRLLIGVGALAAGITVSTVTKSPSLGGNLGRLTQALTQELGSGLLVNPYSRERELEADHIGLFLMADAGYNPEASVNFWARVENHPEFTSTLEFFSTHPPPVDRLTALRLLLPQATARYALARSSGGTTTNATPTFVDKYYSQGAAPHSAAPPPVQKELQKDPGKDSFDWGGAASESAQADWQVRAKKTMLYAAASESSKKIGEFSADAVVTGEEHGSGWVEIQVPDHGFIRKSDLKKIAR